MLAYPLLRIVKNTLLDVDILLFDKEILCSTDLGMFFFAMWCECLATFILNRLPTIRNSVLGLIAGKVVFVMVILMYFLIFFNIE